MPPPFETFKHIPVGVVTSGGTTTSDTAWTVTATTAFPATSTTAQFHVCDPAANTELILVTSAPGGTGSGQSWTVTRGADGTTPVAHTAGFTIYQVVPASWLNDLIVPLPASGDGTGATDVANINALLAAGKPVYLIPGETYTINAPIVMQNQSFLTGWQWNMSSQDDNYSVGPGQPTGAIIQTLSNFSGAAAISLPDPGSSVQNYGVDISGISVVCFSGSVSGMHAMSVIGAWGACFLRGVQLQKGTQDCLHMASGVSGFPDDWQITDCKFSGARNGNGVNIVNNCADSWFDNCESSQNHLAGWSINWCDNARWSNCKGENNGTGGWIFTANGSDHLAMFSNCTSQDNQNDGWLWESGTTGEYLLTGCRSHNDNASSSTFAGFRVTGGSALVMGAGCWATGSAYGAYQGSSATGSLAFTGSYLTGTTAATFDDGTNTVPLINNVPAFSPGATFAGPLLSPKFAGRIVRDQVSNLYTSAGSNTATITFPFNPTAGAKVLVAISNESGTPVLTDNGTSPTTFTADVSETAATNNVFIFRGDNITLPASGGYTISVTSGGNTFAAQAVSYLGLQSGHPYLNAKATGTSTTAATSALNTCGLAFGAFSDSNTSTHSVALTGGSPFTELATSTSGGSNPGAFAAADWIDAQAEPTSQAVSWTLGASSLWEVALALYPAYADLIGVPNIFTNELIVTGLTQGTGVKIFDVDNSVGAHEFSVYDNGQVSTKSNILDDNAGNVAITGNTKLAAGTTSLAPLTFQSGTNLTSAAAGDAEYDGASAYFTNETTSGRGLIPVEQKFRLTAAGSNITTIANFFGTTSNISLVSGAEYEIEIDCWFAKNVGAGTVTWTFTNSAAPTAMNIEYKMSPATGLVSTAAATSLFGDQYDVTTAAATVVSGSLTSGVNHHHKFWIRLINGTGTSLQIQATVSSQSITPGINSSWKCRRVPAANVGTFSA